MTDKKSPAGAVGIEPDLVRELAAILRDTGLSEIEVEHGDLRVRISGAMAPAIHHHTAAISAPLPAAAPVAAAPPPPPADLRTHPGAVISPMVGTAYLSPKPDEPSYVKLGDMVSEGQTIMVVEAMKTFNPIPAHKAGRLTQVLVANEQPVEYGQPLAVIE